MFICGEWTDQRFPFYLLIVYLWVSDTMNVSVGINIRTEHLCVIVCARAGWDGTKQLGNDENGDYCFNHPKTDTQNCVPKKGWILAFEAERIQAFEHRSAGRWSSRKGGVNCCLIQSFLMCLMDGFVLHFPFFFSSLSQVPFGGVLILWQNRASM